MSATLSQFAALMDAVAATAAKLEKQRLLAEYLRGLADEDLRLAVRFAAGRSFAATDERVLAVGGALLWGVLLETLPLDHAELRRRTIASGEIGQALRSIWPVQTVERPLALRDLAVSFERLASTGNQGRKRSLLRSLLERCATGPEATYLTKIIFRDMRTGVQEGLLQAAVAQAFERKLPAIQRCQLLVGDLEEVALLARHDQLCSATFHLFHPIQFMLATPQESPEQAAATLAGREFLVEDKFDGIRAQLHKQGNRVAIFTRTMDRADESFPEVVAAMKHIEGDFLIDGEIVPFAAGAVSPFMHLQRRLGRKKPSAAVLKRYPVTFIAFDILYDNGDLLIDQPLRLRRGRLEAFEVRTKQNITPISTATSEQEIAAAFEASKNRRNEGLVLKDPESIYSPGRRGKLWLKLKTHLPTLDCVVTAAEYGHGKRANTLSDYTFAVWSSDPATPDARLLNIGKAYSGVTDEEIVRLTALFKSIALSDNGHTFLVPPRVVMEIAFDQIQRSARHESGYALRFPRIKTIRWDKPPEQADHLARVEEIYQSSANTSKDAGQAHEPLEQPEPTLFDQPK